LDDLITGETSVFMDGSSKQRGVGMSYGKTRRNEERLKRRLRVGATLKSQWQGIQHGGRS